MDESNFLEEIRFWEHPVCRDRPDRGEEQEILQGESDGLSSPTQPQDSSWYDGEAKKWFFVYFRRFYFPSTSWTQSQTVRADWRIIPHSTWCYQDYRHKFWCDVGKTCWRLLERRWSKRIVRHVVGKGVNSLSHFYLVHKFIFRPQAMKIPVAKAAVEK